MNKRKILIGGASGFVGKALVEHFENRGWQVVKLSRSHQRKQIFWDVENAYLNPHSISNFDAVISLAGENIFTRWTKKNRFKIISSRINSAEAISKAISLSAKPPKVFLCASAIGYYGHNKTTNLTENSPYGKGFLSDVCRYWEFASQCAKTENTRVVNMRFGLVLGEHGGFFALAKKFMRCGIRLIFGDGTCKFSWISLKDLCRAIEFIVENQSIEGAVNFTSPSPCSYADFSDTCKTLTGFSLPLKLPKWLLHFLFGQLADEMIFANTKVLPKKLIDNGFQFENKNILSFVNEIKLHEKSNQNNPLCACDNSTVKCVLKRK